MRKYTEKDVELILSGKYKVKELSKLLNRSEEAIKHKKYRLNNIDYTREYTRKYMKEYQQRPYVIEKQNIYMQRPEIKERHRQACREYMQRPEVKEKYRKLMKFRRDNNINGTYDKTLAYNREYKQNHKEEILEYSRLYREKKKLQNKLKNKV